MENKSVIINKYESIEKCINRINEEYEGNSEKYIRWRERKTGPGNTCPDKERSAR